MNKISISIFMGILLLISACGVKNPSASKSMTVERANNSSVKFTEQSTWLLGYFSVSRLSEEPYSEWYLKGYDDYTPETTAINSLYDISKDSLSIKIVMGTWCPDSRKHVPHFMKILDTWKFPVTKVTFIGVDDAKQSPLGEYPGLDIKRVPTFIVYKNNIETGRIIENPVTSLEQDLVNILTGMNNNK